MPRGIDADALLAGYRIALEGQPIEALQSVVLKLVKGTWTEEVTFCPRPPELANMVREEARRQREISMPRIAYQPAEKPPMVALMTKKYAHRKVLAENIAMGDFRPSDWPAGVCFVPILGKVFAADETEAKKKEAAPSTRLKRTQEPPRAFHEPIKDPEYWEQINSLRDSPAITEEQMAFRRKIGKEIESSAPDIDKQAAQ